MRRAVRDTSIISLEQLREELGDRQRLVLELIETHPHRTDRELARIAGAADPNVIRPRRSELYRKGLVRESGKRPCGVTGKLSTTWAAAEAGDQLELFGGTEG